MDNQELKIGARYALTIAGNEIDFLHMRHRQDLDEIKLLNEEIRILREKCEQQGVTNNQNLVSELVATEAENNKLKDTVIVWRGLFLVAVLVSVVAWVF